MNDIKFKFSVIIPIYKVEEYLEETILSVVKQNIGFEKNIQIILVNDGSPDNSEEICLKYVKKYPNNIIYIKQENKGVSAARNNGMQYAEGKYINFLDSDDTWEKDVFKKVYDFFEQYYDEIDLVACRMRFFGKVNGFKHALDYKFKKDRIVNIRENYVDIQLSVTSAFFKKTAILKYKYDENLKYSEDAKIIAQLLTEKEKYGILPKAVHNYRRREDNTSAIQTGVLKKEWYNDTVEKSYEEVFNYSRQKYGKVLPYFQYQIMYDLQWRLTIPVSDILNEEEKKRYINSIKKLLKEIEDYIICGQRMLPIEGKIYALNLKYDNDVKRELNYRNKVLFYKNIGMTKLFNNYLMNIRILDIKDDKLHLEGQITCVLDEKDYSIYFENDNGDKYNIEYYNMKHKNKSGIDRVILEPRGFKVEIPISEVENIRAIFNYKNENELTLKLKFMGYSKLNGKYRRSYYKKDNYIVKSHENVIYISKNTKWNHFKMEIMYMMQLAKNLRVFAIFYRIFYYITGIFYRKPIWIVSDRPDMADDNGLHMFRYLIENEKNAKIYFAISKSSNDYKKVKRIGKVLCPNTFTYKMKFLHADKIISSQANEFVLDAFGKNKQCIKDLYKYDFVFLQHGIIKDDLSEWLHKQNKNITMFVTSSKKEYDSIVNGNYAYDKNVVKLTGLPRYDKLKTGEEPNKQILIMPTWRKKLAGKEINNLGEREYNTEFKESDYYEFYNKLINDKRLIEVMSKKGYTGRFCIHPILKKQYIDFEENEYIKIVKDLNDYQKEFKESKLLITDFSSVAFDFAYLKKPIIYAQFDADTFFEGHMYTKGYFEYEKDGLGEVCYDYETTVQNIIKLIENDCRLEKKYEDRINKFYYKFDDKNCERVYKEILKL